MATAETSYGTQSFEEDTIETSAGPLVVTCVGHGTLMLRFRGLVIHVDPVAAQALYQDMPRADLILVTHTHGDHLDPAAIGILRKTDTDIVLTQLAADQVRGGRIAHNGDRITVRGLPIEAVPAYNIRHARPDGKPFHPRGQGNGYLVTFGNKRLYIAGDTEDTPEMRALRGVDVAFLPMNLPYTMSPQMVADAVRAFQPAILYPYHTGETDVRQLALLLRDLPGVEIRVRRLS